MREYNNDCPESTDWPDERWTLSDPCGCDWTDEEQWAREEMGREACPVSQDDGRDPPAYDDEAC